jgi:heme-degrading monooxygenase HmoA
MIARLWRGSAAREKANDYLEHLQQNVFPELGQIDGYCGAYLLRRDLNDGVEFTVLTLWETMDAIRKFAGQDAERAVVAPAAQALLRDFDSTAAHYEVALRQVQKDG